MNNKAGIVILTENHLLKEKLVNKIRSNDHYEIIATFNDGGICEDYLATHTCDLLVIDLINDYFMDEGTTFVYNDVVYGIFNKSGSSYIYDMNENEVVFSVEGDLEFNEKGYFVTVDGDAYYSLKGEKIYKR